MKGEQIAEYVRVTQALSLLWNAARVSPHLREAVEVVESEVYRLRELVEQYDGDGRAS